MYTWYRLAPPIAKHVHLRVIKALSATRGKDPVMQFSPQAFVIMVEDIDESRRFYQDVPEPVLQTI